jgi:protein-S-isoprenylcysteine O-methyltransferase Ste14
MKILAIRSFALLLPLLGATAGWLWAQPSRRQAGAVYLATLWTLPALTAVHLLAQRFGWWSFSFEGGGLFGMPVDLWIGWALLWGTLPALLLSRISLTAVVALSLVVDLIAMPLCAPVLQLGARWLIGETIAIAVALIPAQLLARWTSRDERLRARVVLQFLLFVALVLIGVPALVLTLTSSRIVLEAPYLVGQAAVLAAMAGITAVHEFAERGGGTPFPYDAPKRLVRSGIYAYVRNPMQLATSVLFALIAVATGNVWLALACVVSVAYAAGLAAWDEGADLRERFGAEAVQYADAVRNWLPTWRPSIDADSTIYFAAGCDPCSDIAVWLQNRSPHRLKFVAAEEHPTMDLDRVRYEAPDGYGADGIVAIARALEHIHLGWATLGFAMRLPLARSILQVIVDASGGGRRAIKRASLAARPFD